MSDQNFTIQQGATLNFPFYWYDGDLITTPITAAAPGFPPILTATAHGLPINKIPARLETLGTWSDLDTPDGETVYVLKTGANTFSVPSYNGAELPAYVGAGYLSYQAPKDITGYTARMQLRPSIASSVIILSLTSAGGTLVMGGTEGSVTVSLSAIATAALTFQSAVYQLELVTPDGVVVTRLAGGKITLSKEVTR